MEKTLKLFTYVDGGTSGIPFPNEDDQIEIGSFRYDAKRMGGAPTITASVMYPTTLDGQWSDRVYAEFNHEKYYLKQTPTCSYSNEDERYKHDLTLVSERSILDNVYFFDTVVGKPEGDDKPVSNSTKFVFFGNIREFAKRLNASLEYSQLLTWTDGVDEDGNAIKIANGYNIVVDDDVVNEEKLMSFEDQFFSNVLQEIYNVYEVPYYFDGKTIHVGYSKSDVVLPPLSYGVDDALLSITKNNANYKVVNRVTGTGSSDNIPFYYPNNSPKGNIVAETNRQFGVTILNYDTFANKVETDGVITYKATEATVTRVTSALIGGNVVSGTASLISKFTYKGATTDYKMYITSSVNGIIPLTITPILNFKKYDNDDDEVGTTAYGTTTVRIFSQGKQLGRADVDSYGHTFEINLPKGDSVLDIKITFMPEHDSSLNRFEGTEGIAWSTSDKTGWYYKDKEVDLADLGLSVSNASLRTGDTITQKVDVYIPTSQNLMPLIYRTTSGNVRFYNATNNTYEGVTFNNPYVAGKPKEHIISVEDIKPTIKEKYNSENLRMDMFTEFAYDLDDNDELIENEEGNEHEYVHSYFFAKLRKLDFNLFDHAIENQPMTISFTSGDCGACNFEIGVTEEFPQKNPVQVNADGTLKRDEKGRVICGQFEDITEDECQPQQQDTINNEVWIALKKEDTTYGILMPKATVYEKDEDGNIVYDDNGNAVVKEVGHKPKGAIDENGNPNNEGDTFVILGINLPISYIIAAEKKLEDEIIKYMKDNNDEKFTFSIGFSRIFFEENATVLESLSENSKIQIIYDNQPYDLYVTSFSYNMGEGDVLPEIRVELDDTLKVSQNALQNAINSVKTQLGNALNNIDVVGAVSPYFIRKDVDDEVIGNVNFKKGIKFGEGGEVEILDNNSAKLTIEYLEVTKKASFTSLEIKEKTHVGGQMLITPAAITCGEVEEYDDYYRCYFQTKGADGDEIFNQFTVDDQAICQTYNAWGSRYYWRLVVGVGEDYIDLSKTDCDANSDVPMSGDKIIQLGNRNDKARQAAQVLSSYGENAPSFIMYNGINSFSLEGKNITGIVWNPETQEPQMYSYGSFFFGNGATDEDGNLVGDNYITYQKAQGKDEKELYINANVTLGSNSTGLSNLSEFNALTDTVRGVQDQIDGVVENWSAEGHPYIDSYPVSEWATDAEKIAHINDTYVNIEAYVDDESTPTAGQAWRWCQCTEGTTPYFEIEKEVTSTDWERIGKIDPNAPYVVVQTRRNGTVLSSVGMAFDTDIQVYSGPPVYIKVEEATGDVYIKDVSRFFESYPVSLRFIYTGFVSVEDKDGNRINLHWHPIADSDAVRALKDAATANRLLESVDNDNVLTGIEKHSIRESIKKITSERYPDDLLGQDYEAVGTGTFAERYNELNRKGYDGAADSIYDTLVEILLLLNNNGVWDDGNSEVEPNFRSQLETLLSVYCANEAYGTNKLSSDFDYLSETLGKSLDVEGAVLAQTLAVKDGNNNVNAMLNGSDLGEDDTCGKLMIAAGIPATSSSGSTTLGDRVKEATTRVYEDGCIYSKKLHLQTGSTIGNIEIIVDETTGKGALQIGEVLVGDWMRISDGVILCGNEAADGTKQSISISGCNGNAMHISVGGYGLSCVEREAHVGLDVDVPEGWAHCVSRGVFAGLRPKTRVLTSNMTTTSRNVLNEFDFSVLINTTSGTCYMQLPSAPCDGQEYIIESKGAGLNIISTDRTVYSMSSGNTEAVGGATTKAAGRYILRFKYYAAIQQWTCGTLQ